MSDDTKNKSKHKRCGRCGYDLHGLEDAKCPECGAVKTLDPEILKKVRRRKILFTIIAMVIILPFGGALQFLGFGFLFQGEKDTFWPLILFFGPLGIIYGFAVYYGFMLYPIYCVIISLSSKPKRTAKSLVIIHYASALIGMCGVVLVAKRGTFSSNANSIVRAFKDEFWFMALIITLFLLSHILLYGLALILRNLERQKYTIENNPV